MLLRRWFNKEKDQPKTVSRFRVLATLMLAFSLYFVYETWTVIRNLLTQGLSWALALQRAGIWLASSLIILLTALAMAYCAWLAPKQGLEASRATKDERDLEVARRSSHGAMLGSMLLFLLVLPLGEILLLKRYPLLSLGAGGLMGLSWLAAYIYWSHRL